MLLLTKGFCKPVHEVVSLPLLFECVASFTRYCKLFMLYFPFFPPVCKSGVSGVGRGWEKIWGWIRPCVVIVCVGCMGLLGLLG